jgi:C-terminal processing protease CtpA/Prc
MNSCFLNRGREEGVCVEEPKVLEQFSYNLKMLKRAKLVGETTRGGSHAGIFHRIDDHFGMGIPEEKAINPFGKADWEGVGVEPDVKVRAAEALETAVKLAKASVGAK